MTYLLIALRLLPLVIQAIQAVESVIGPGQGEKKKALVMSVIPASSAAGEKPDPKHDATLSALIDRLVAVLNIQPDANVAAI